MPVARFRKRISPGYFAGSFLVACFLFVAGFGGGIAFLFHGRTPGFSNIGVKDHRPSWARANEIPDGNSNVDTRTKDGRALPTPGQAKAAIELWVIIGGFQVGFWCAAVPMTMFWCISQSEYWWPLRIGDVVRTVAMVVALLTFINELFVFFLIPWTGAGTAGAPSEWNVGFHHSPAGLGGAGVFATLLAGVPILALGLAGSWLARNRENLTLEVLIGLWRAVQGLLLLVGVGLALSTLGMAALMRARRANVLEAPIEYVWIHGIVHSLVIALAYAPIHVRLLDAIRFVCDREAPLPRSLDPEMTQKLAKRRDLEQFTGLQANGFGSLGAGWPVLLPLASSLMSTILGPST